MRRVMERVPERVRLLVLTLCYGGVGGMVTVAFMLATNHLFTSAWYRLNTLGTGAFLACDERTSARRVGGVA